MGIHLCSATSSRLYDGPHTGCAFVLQTTISEGVVWGRVSHGLYKTTTKDFPRRALLAAPKEAQPTSELLPVELPQRARPKGCFNAYYAFNAYYTRSVDELSGRTTGRLGHDRPDSAYAIGGTAELALRYSN
jgi:hypothetical protein